MSNKKKFSSKEANKIVEERIGSPIGGLEDKEYSRDDIEEIIEAMLETRILEEEEKNEK